MMISEWTVRMGFTALAFGLAGISAALYLDHETTSKLEKEKARILTNLDVELKRQRDLNRKIEQYLKVCAE